MNSPLLRDEISREVMDGKFVRDLAQAYSDVWTAPVIEIVRQCAEAKAQEIVEEVPAHPYGHERTALESWEWRLAEASIDADGFAALIEQRRACASIGRPDFWERKAEEQEQDWRAYASVFLDEWRQDLDKRIRLWKNQLIAECVRQLEESLRRYFEALRKLKLRRDFLRDYFSLRWFPGRSRGVSHEIEETIRWSLAMEALPNLEDLCDQLGRLTDCLSRKERQVVREKIRYDAVFPDVSSKEEIVGVGVGRNVEDLLPQELAQLSNPDTELLFDLKYVEGRLMCLEKSGYVREIQEGEIDRAVEKDVRERKGPVILCIDTSGSMAGLPENAAKAIALFMARRCRQQDRSCYLINFGMRIVTKELTGEWSMDDVLEFLGGSWGGGTDANEALSHAVEMLKMSFWSNADVLMLSDLALPVLSSDTERDVHVQRRQGTKFHAVWIVDDWGNGEPGSSMTVYDAIWRYSIRTGTVERLDDACKGMGVWAGK